MAKRSNRVKEVILQLLEDEGPLHPYGLYKMLKGRGPKIAYGTVKWQLLFMKTEGLVRTLLPWEAERLGLKTEPDRSGRSYTRPWINRVYYTLT